MARRRVVTGLNAEGVSVIVRDGPAPGRLESGWEELWSLDGVPASLTDPTDLADLATFRLCPAPGRMVSRIFTICSRAAYQMAGEPPAGPTLCSITQTRSNLIVAIRTTYGCIGRRRSTSS